MLFSRLCQGLQREPNPPEFLLRWSAHSFDPPNIHNCAARSPPWSAGRGRFSSGGELQPARDRLLEEAVVSLLHRSTRSPKMEGKPRGMEGGLGSRKVSRYCTIATEYQSGAWPPYLELKTVGAQVGSCGPLLSLTTAQLQHDLPTLHRHCLQQRRRSPSARSDYLVSSENLPSRNAGVPCSCRRKTSQLPSRPLCQVRISHPSRMLCRLSPFPASRTSRASP